MSKTLSPNPQSFNYFEALFKNTKENHLLLLDSKGIIKKINSTFTHVFGYSDEELLDTHFRVLFTQEDQMKGLPDKEVANVLTRGQSNDNNYMVHKNKSITWVSGESIRVENPDGETGILKVIQDINIQKSFEQSLLNLNEFLERILSAIDDIVIVIDNRMNIVKVNTAFHKSFGHSHGSPSATLLEVIKGFQNHNGLPAKILDCFSNGPVEVAKEVAIEILTGEKRMFDINCRPIESINHETHLMIILHDRTTEYQSEKQKEDIIGFVAHELRNPLANIVLANDLLSDMLAEKNMTDALNFLKKSKNNVSRLTKMITELYDATKVHSGNLKLEPEQFNFAEMITEAVETMNVLHPQYNIIVEGNANIMISGDRNKIIQVVTNYLSNGIKYSQGSHFVALEMIHSGHQVRVAVKDQGLGISPDQIPLVFNRFFRAEKTKNLEGIGLGLYLCRQIIEAHQGKVWVESEEGKGSTFYFSLPI